LVERCNEVNPCGSVAKLEPRIKQAKSSPFILGSECIQRLRDLYGNTNTSHCPTPDSIICAGELVALYLDYSPSMLQWTNIVITCNFVGSIVLYSWN
jgi:hypothetical protein